MIAMFDIGGDLEKRMQAEKQTEPMVTGGLPVAQPSNRYPVRVAYAIIILSALLVGAGATALLTFADTSILEGTARWVAPLVGILLFALIGICLVRSATTELR